MKTHNSVINIQLSNVKYRIVTFISFYKNRILKRCSSKKEDKLMTHPVCFPGQSCCVHEAGDDLRGLELGVCPVKTTLRPVEAARELDDSVRVAVGEIFAET